MSPPRPITPGESLGFARGALVACGRPQPERWLLVEAATQSLFLLESGAVRRAWPVSTSSVGLDNRDGSGGTPPGVHRIAGLIGADATAGTVFESRKPTGRIWRPREDADESDLILTRIILLDGCEEGLNKGPGVDSRERYIYIHGTNHEPLVGEPVSGGCVRMTNNDVVELFDLVAEGDLVVIV